MKKKYVNITKEELVEDEKVKKNDDSKKEFKTQ